MTSIEKQQLMCDFEDCESTIIVCGGSLDDLWSRAYGERWVHSLDACDYCPSHSKEAFR